MKLGNIAKIFGVLTFLSFIAAVWEIVTTYNSDPKYSFLGMTIIFLLAGIMATIKRVALDMEKSE